MPVLVGKLDAEVKKIVGREQRMLEKLNNYVIELGVIAGESKERKQVVSFGLTNAELLFIHENGSPVKNIPARPVLDIVIQHVRDVMVDEFIDNCFDLIANDKWNDATFERELGRFCMRIQNYAQQGLRKNEFGLEKLKHREGIPLVDTGQLSRSIVCRYVKATE